MDAYEATRIVLSRIQNLDPENASKIMGLLLIQDHGEKEMIRLAFGPEALVHSVVLKARRELGISSNTSSTPSTPSSPSPFLSQGNPLSRQNSSSSRFSITTHSFSATYPWAASCFSDILNREDLVSPSFSSTSYSAVASNGIGKLVTGSTSSPINSSTPPFYGSGVTDLIDELQLQDQLSFLNDGSPTLGPKSPELFYPNADFASSPSGTTGADSMLFHSYGGAGNWGSHRRCFSVSDICLGSEDSACGLGWKPCLYYARGYCKNGTSCRFLHGGVGDSASAVMGLDGAAMVGSPSKFEMMEQCQELLRSKSTQQQRLAAASQLMNSASNFPYSPASPTNKSMNFLLQQQQSDSPWVAALMMGEEMHKFGLTRLDRSEFAINGGAGMVNSPGSRQIYLTFPADSTFREEDVSNYFSIYGPVQDVRIPYQQKRMFGFVTFAYPETVKLILAKGNPHFVCDARVLVKPYKEKGKIPDKFRKQQQQQQMERGDFSMCGSPTGLDSRDPFDNVQLGPKMFCNTQDLLWKKLEEQADLQQAIELQGRKLMGLQLLDVKRQNHQRALSAGAGGLSSPTTHCPNFLSQPLSTSVPSYQTSPEIILENGLTPSMAAIASVAADEKSQRTVNVDEERESLTRTSNIEQNGKGKESPNHHEENELPESLEHNLPDSPFASPKAAGEDYMMAFSGMAEENAATAALAMPSAYSNNLMIASSLLPASTQLDLASFKPCYLQVPRLSSGHGAIGM